MPEPTHNRTVIYKIFILVVAYLVVTGWVLSTVHRLHWLGILSLPGLVAAGLLARRWRDAKSGFWQSFREPLAYWPFLLVAGLALLGQLLYPPTMLDSLTYRLPRLFLWLQNDSIQHVMSAEPRLNYMPQTWGLATLPLVQLAGDRLVWCWSFGSWILLYLLAYDWALELNGEVKKSRLMAFLASTSTFAVLQGASSATDLFAGVMALLALRFAINFERTRNWHEINWAGLSFCIAAGTKPHFAVFGLPVTLWFFLSPSRPWKAFRWAWLPALLVVWLLCSPVPSFVMNSQTYGTWAGPGQDETMKGKSPLWNILLGSAMIGWQSIQPPVNPAALTSLNRTMVEMTRELNLNSEVPRFNFRLYPVSIVDSAGLGLVTSILLVAGMVLAVRRRPPLWKSWQMTALAAGLVCILLALSHFVSGSSGRAYGGFLLLALPLALAGWDRMRTRALSWGLYCSLGSCLLVLVLNPSHPLWPARWAQQELAGSTRFQCLAKQMKLYLLFSERARAGEDLMRAVPADEPRVVVVAGEDQPLLPIFRPYFQKRQLLFLPAHATPADLRQTAAHYVVVGPGAKLTFPELCDHLATSGDYRLVMEKDYTSTLTRGPEPWMLYERLNQADEATNR